jgi:hypothetical protein
MTPSPIHSRRVALAAAGVFMLYGRSAERKLTPQVCRCRRGCVSDET